MALCLCSLTAIATEDVLVSACLSVHHVQRIYSTAEGLLALQIEGFGLATSAMCRMLLMNLADHGSSELGRRVARAAQVLT